MKKSLKRLLGSALSLALLFLQAMPVGAAAPEQTAYEVTFVTEGHATVDVYYTKDYTTPDETNVSKTEARSGGNIDVSGDGQVNFRVNVEAGYDLVSVTADQNYKNLKGASDTGVEGIYRLTKITGPVTVTIATKQQGAQYGDAKDIVLNEIESNGDATDWVEIYNKGTLPVDISGWYITDDDTTRLQKGKTTPLPDGTVLNPGEFLVFDQYVNFDFGLGAPDEANLFDASGNLVEKYSWSTHAEGVFARIPDGAGEWKDVTVSTKGAANKDDTTVKPSYPNAIAWPGSDQVITYDEGITMFQSDSSGLDFHNGQLYCINNKKGTFWVLDVSLDGTLTYANGFTARGKDLSFLADAANPVASNPDAEGITVDENGKAYAAVERDNNNKNVNYNVILQFDPWAEGDVVVASKEWNITNLLPDVPANSGIEAVEWVPNAEVAGKLMDQNTGAAFDPANYPNATANGVFFTALENNGHVYALVLQEDGSAVMIADLDPGMGHAVSLDYDAYEKILWVGDDNDRGNGNLSAQIRFNGTAAPEITLVNPPAGMDATRNNEGFAIADPEYTVNGLRPVYHFMDGANTGVLTISYLNCDYQPPHVHTEVTIPGKAPTCTETGLSDGVQCSTCNEWLTAQTVLPALGHIDENQDGLCDRCGEKVAQEEKPSTNPEEKPGNNGNTGNGSGDQSGNGDKNPTPDAPKTPELPDKNAPHTGTDSNMMLWLGLLAASGIGTALTVVVSRKRRNS